MGVGVGLPLACQALPPFHVLTHEFTQLFTVVAAVVVFFLAAWCVRWVPVQRGTEVTTRLSLGLAVTAWCALAMAASTYAVMVVASLVAHGCHLVEGSVFFWITWPPAAALTGVIGALLGERQWRWHWLTAAIGAVVGLSLLHDAAQAMWGPQIVDVIAGKPLAFDVRAGMEIPRVHGLQRLWLAAIAGAVWNLALWRHGRRQVGTDAAVTARTARHRGAALAVLVVVCVVLVPSYVGLGWGRGALHRHLSGEIRTEHLVVRHAPGGQGELFAPAVARDAEWWWHWLSEQWGYEPDTTVWIYLFEDGHDMADFTLTRSAHAQSRAINLTWHRALTSTLMHELVHVLHFERVGARMPLLGRGLIEGFAMAYDEGYALHPHAHGQLAAAHRGDTLPPATQVMSLTGFWTVDEGNAYDAAGSFVGFLLHEYGWEAFDTLQMTLDYRQAYGHDLETLDQQWRAFLDGVPVDLAQMAAARESFDPTLQPSYSDECCPKLGSPATERDATAQRRWGAGDIVGALEIYRALYAEDPDPRWAFQIVQCLRSLEREGEALPVVDGVLASPDLPEDERFRFLRERMFCLMAEQRWAELDGVLADMDAIQEPTPDQALLAASLRDPELRDVVARTLTRATWFEGRRTMEDLIAQRPDDEAVRFLHVTWFLAGFSRNRLRVEPWARQRALELLEHAEVAPDVLDVRADGLLSLADEAVRNHEPELASHICTAMVEGCARPLNRVYARRCLDRIAWEGD